MNEEAQRREVEELTKRKEKQNTDKGEQKERRGRLGKTRTRESRDQTN
jgi:hypothetical protein